MIDLDNTWCEATEENFNALIKGGVKYYFRGDKWCDIESDSSYLPTDIFFVEGIDFNWAVKHAFNAPDCKEIHLVNGQFRYVEESKSEGEKVNPTCPSNFGFEIPAFECEIYSEDTLGGCIGTAGGIHRFWTKEGLCFYLLSGKRKSEWDLTSIKKPWYEDEKNIGKIINVNYGLGKGLGLFVGYINNKIEFSLVKGKLKGSVEVDMCRPATKEEILSLVVEV